MTEDQITELFIRAATVDRKLPDTARPAKLKAINHGYVHDTADLNGWSSEDKHAANWAWLDPANLRNSTNDMGLWSAALELIKLVPSEKNRRSLWAWAASEAGGKAFAKWCRSVEGISRQVGNYRRKAAIVSILRAFDRKPLQHNDIDEMSPLTNDPETDDKKHMIGVWRADDAVPLHFDESLRDFSWAEAQSERRRQREAKRKAA